MYGKYVITRLIVIQIALTLMLFCGGVEAKGLETALWGIGWEADNKSVKQIMENNRFTLLNEGKYQDGKAWQRYGDGLYSGFQCDIEYVWQAGSLSAVNIESKGLFLLGPDSIFQSLVTQFTDEYGQPSEREAYMLKIFPGIWVEGVKWLVTGNGGSSFEVTVVENKAVLRPKGNLVPSDKILISFKKTS